MPSITNLFTATAITAFEHKIPNVSNLAKETDYTTKTSETVNKVATDQDHDKYITAQKFNKLTEKIFTVRLAQANLSRKNDIANFVKKIDLDNRDFDNKLKNLNKTVTLNKQNIYLLKVKQMDYQKKLKQYQQKDQQKIW